MRDILFDRKVEATPSSKDLAATITEYANRAKP